MYDLDRLKEQTDIIAVARDLGLDLKREGAHYLARCPAHPDGGRPNLVLSSRKGAKCFRCGWSSDVIGLVAKVKGLEPGDAIRWLAGRAGLSPEGKPAGGLGYRTQGTTAPIYPKTGAPLTEPAPEPVAVNVPVSLRQEVYTYLLAMADWGPDFFQPEDADTPAVLAARWLEEHKGITLATQAEHGVCWLEDWLAADRELKARFGTETLAAMGLLTKTGDLHFRRHRLLFPFWRKTGDSWKPVYFQGRNIQARDKRDRFDNPSGPVPCPYNVGAVATARVSGAPLFLCEGVTDTLTLLQSGRLACGIVGAQGFKAEWARHFKGLSVYLVFDPDTAGQEAARKVAAVFAGEGLPAPRIVPLPEGQDVTDFFTGQSTTGAART